MMHAEKIIFHYLLILQFEWPSDMIENTFAAFLDIKNLSFLININDPKVCIIIINNSGCLLVISQSHSTSTKTERKNAIN